MSLGLLRDTLVMLLECGLAELAGLFAAACDEHNIASALAAPPSEDNDEDDDEQDAAAAAAETDTPTTGVETTDGAAMAWLQYGEYLEKTAQQQLAQRYTARARQRV